MPLDKLKHNHVSVLLSRAACDCVADHKRARRQVNALRFDTLVAMQFQQPRQATAYRCLVRVGKVTSKASQDVLDSSLFGCLLMVGYLGIDGFTSTWQDKMFKGYSMSIYNQILYVQLCSACVSFTSLIMFGQVRPVRPCACVPAFLPCERRV